jgi:tetratricopeptide (TPR) repeat protein
MKEDWFKSIAVLVKALAENKQSPMTWFGLGKAYYYYGDFINSRICLNQANVYDHTNPQIWSFLILNVLKGSNY